MPPTRFHHALLWERLTNQRVRCFACAQLCKIRPDQYGICGVRKNIEGELFTCVYEYPVAVHTDPIEKKPLFHFLPGSRTLSLGTAGCNFHCLFCQNYDISQMRGAQIEGSPLSVAEAVDLAEEQDCESVAYTYNEPVVFLEYVLDVALEAQKRGLKNVYISNGFETEQTLDLLEGKIDAMNIDLKSFSDKFYRKLCQGKLEPVLKTIRSARERGIWIEVTTLIIPEENDSEEEIRAIARFLASLSADIPWHLSRYFPNYKLTSKAPTRVSLMERAAEIGHEEGLHYIYLGNTPQEHSITYCAHCNQKLIIRDRYDLRYNFLDQDHCPACGQKLSGVFQ